MTILLFERLFVSYSSSVIQHGTTLLIVGVENMKLHSHPSKPEFPTEPRQGDLHTPFSPQHVALVYPQQKIGHWGNCSFLFHKELTFLSEFL